MTKTVSLRFHDYMGRSSKMVDVPAAIVGELAIHRPGFLQPNGDISTSRRWTVSHIPTGALVDKALPVRFWDRGAIVATRAELVEWAGKWQEVCPEFMAATRELDGAALNSTPELAALARDAMGKGRAL